MPSDFQTIAALGVVALVIAAFILRSLARRRNRGCAGDCGCHATEVKAKLKR